MNYLIIWMGFFLYNQEMFDVFTFHIMFKFLSPRKIILPSTKTSKQSDQSTFFIWILHKFLATLANFSGLLNDNLSDKQGQMRSFSLFVFFCFFFGGGAEGLNYMKNAEPNEFRTKKNCITCVVLQSFSSIFFLS